MIIIDLDFDLNLIQGSKPAVGDGKRSPGLHLTDIIHSMEADLGLREGSASEEQLATYAAMGFVWERIVEQGIALACQNERYVRPGEVMLDGIAGSPDLLDSDHRLVIDTKALFKSSNKLDDLARNFWGWTIQLKGYCHMVSQDRAQSWNTAELWVIPICGNWKPPMIGPPVRKRLQFTRVELADNWRMLMQHATEKGML